MRVLLLCLLLSPLSALAQDAAGSVRRWSESQALTRAAPTGSCLDTSAVGMMLKQARAFRVMLEAPSGQTLTGGKLEAWYYDWGPGVWYRNPANDLAVTSGLSAQAWEDLPAYVGTGCVLYATAGVTVSSGSAVTVRITAWTGGSW